MSKEATSLPRDEQWRPLAQVAIWDEPLRSEVSQILREEGWAVVVAPTGYHLLQNVAGLPFTDESWWKPCLIVADAFSPGVSGLTIALGLKDLGWSVPALLIARTPAQLESATQQADPQIFVTPPEDARTRLLAVARGSQGGRKRACAMRVSAGRHEARVQTASGLAKVTEPR